MERSQAYWQMKTFSQLRQCYVRLLCHDAFDLFYVLLCKSMGTSRRSFVDNSSFILIDLYPSLEGRLADVKDRKTAFYGKFPLKNSMDSCGTNFRRFSFHAMNYTQLPKN